MHLKILATLIATVSATTPSCARRGLFDLGSPSASLTLIQPPVNMDLMRCMGICRLYPGCGGFASTGRKLPTDWCFIFKAGVYATILLPLRTYQLTLATPRTFEGVLRVPTTSADDATLVWFWEASCIQSPVGL
ncbi:hypothetical protein DE146DRAFT_605085 [Phaeosphaeria sp. MPI-PUGE-AT-0046c]|nr:hypothetical protein DE146DRAFT_605085 [Phaeosphaeria sp. MPI-PUGE-AT-0046c]